MKQKETFKEPLGILKNFKPLKYQKEVLGTLRSPKNLTKPKEPKKALRSHKKSLGPLWNHIECKGTLMSINEP